MRDFLRRLFTRTHAVDLSGECKHVWTNWSDPEECSLVVKDMLYSGRWSEAKEMQGWEQHRSCVKCNLYEPRLIRGNGFKAEP